MGLQTVLNGSPLRSRSPTLLSDDLDKNALAPPAIELPVEDLLPRPEIQSAVCNRDHNFSTHDLAFQVRVCIVFARSVMTVSRYGLMRRELLQPFIVIMMQPHFVIVDEHGSGDVHGVHQYQPFPHTAFSQARLHLACDVDKTAPGRHFEPEFLAKIFHVHRLTSQRSGAFEAGGAPLRHAHAELQQRLPCENRQLK